MLANNEIYHIFTRSIANFTTFNNAQDYGRMFQLFQFYQIKNPPTSFSTYIKLDIVKQIGFQAAFGSIAKGQEEIVQIIAYCLMPTHIHLILKQLNDMGISVFMGNILNSYSRYFNLNHQRKGPLWESKFQNVLVDDDDQLLHLTRYIHLNPITSFLCDHPKDWQYTSFKEYVEMVDLKICDFSELIELNPKEYYSFVQERAGYQRELGKIKRLILES